MGKKTNFKVDKQAQEDYDDFKKSENQRKNLQKTFDKRNFYTLRDGGFVFLMALVLNLFVGVLFLYICIIIAQNNGIVQNASDLDALYQEAWFIVPYALLTQVVFVLLYVCFHKTQKLSFKATTISFKKANPYTILICAGLGVLCILGFMWLIEGCLGSVFDALKIQGSSVDIPLNTVGWLFADILILGVIPAICEELIFRGIIFKSLRTSFSSLASVLLSALIFALMHQSILQFVYPFILGCILAVVMEKTNNLLYCIILHFFNNFTNIIISFLNNIGAINLSFPTTWWGWLLAIVCAAACCAILYVTYRFYFKKHAKLEEDRVGEATSSSVMVGKMPLSMFVAILLAVVIVVINAVG